MEAGDAYEDEGCGLGHSFAGVCGDRRFLDALHYFAVHNITWRALPTEFGKWNSVWKRFWRLSQSGVFEAFFEALAAMSMTAHFVQMFDSSMPRWRTSRPMHS